MAVGLSRGAAQAQQAAASPPLCGAYLIKTPKGLGGCSVWEDQGQLFLRNENNGVTTAVLQKDGVTLHIREGGGWVAGYATIIRPADGSISLLFVNGPTRNEWFRPAGTK